VYRVASFVAFLTIISKILGLTRDLVIAHYFGTSMQADAFNMAYLFTGNFYIIFGGVGGPFYSAMVAALPKYIFEHSAQEIWTFLKKIVFRTTYFLLAICLFLFVFKPYLLNIFVNKQANPEYFNLTLLNIDILLPLIIIAGPIGILFGVLNCYKKYLEPSLSPAMINVALIVAVFLMGDSFNGLALAIGTSIGGILSLVLQIPALVDVKKNHLKDNPQADLSTSLNQKTFSEILYPALLATVVSQLIVFVDSFFCRDLEQGSWTALVLANRLVQMPLGVLLTAFLVPVFPRIGEVIAQGNNKEVARLLIKSIKTMVVLCIPAVIVGCVWSEDIIRILFQRGAFDAHSTAMVASVFFYLCFSILPYVIRDSLTRALYSYGDSKSPLYVIIFAIFVKLILNYFLVKQFGLDGLAISTTIISILNACVLYGILVKKMRT
jgi:putative peptidoglycan lipid II flippase